MGLLGILARCAALGAGGLTSVLVLFVAVLWALDEEALLRPGRGVEVPLTLYSYNVIVTGSSAGIGFEAAVEFYKLGAHVVVHSSSHQRAVKSARDVELLGAEGRGVAMATPLGADLSDFDEVRSFATTASAILPSVDVLVLNACKMYGLAPWYGDKTLMNQPASAFPSKSGHDSVLAVNHLGHYLLTELLLPHLSFGARILIMTSIGAWDGNFQRLMPPWGHLGAYKLSPSSANDKRILWEQPGLKPHAHLTYRDSKLANVCHARHLRRRLGGNATVVIHDPGLVMTTPMMDRSSKEYQERVYRQRRQAKFRNWHAPTEDGGRHLLEAVYVTRQPAPDAITSYFFPRQFMTGLTGWVSQKTLYDYQRRLPGFQKLSWGLHATVAPECSVKMQDQLADWSARATGLVS